MGEGEGGEMGGEEEGKGKGKGEGRGRPLMQIPGSAPDE